MLQLLKLEAIKDVALNIFSFHHVELASVQWAVFVIGTA